MRLLDAPARWLRVSPLALSASVVAAIVLSVAAAALLTVTRPRYEVRLTVAAAPSPRSVTGLSGVSALAGLAANLGGFQATPLVVAQIMRLDGVLMAVGEASLGDGDRSVSEALFPKAQDIPRERVLRKLRSMIGVETDRPSGLISVRVRHQDSAVVRRVAEELIERAREQFALAMRSQAREARVALTARLDSAARQLRASEETYRQFLMQNREVSRFSAAYVELQRLEREATLAEEVYQQAVRDRENAIARELEETPALVVVDGIPPDVPHTPLSVIRLGVVSTSFGFGSIVILLLLVRAFREQKSLSGREGVSAPAYSQRSDRG